MSGESWGPDVFDRLYASNRDPWGFETSPYEAGKYRDTLDQLALAAPGRRWARGLELGCSIGVFTAMLAPGCDALVAVDAARAAVETARARCAALRHVRIECGMLPAAWPEAPWDLLVVSELLYFLSPADLARLAQLALAAAAPDAVVVLANWTGETDTPHTGDAAAEAFIAGLRPGFEVAGGVARAQYRIDVLKRRTD